MTATPRVPAPGRYVGPPPLVPALAFAVTAAAALVAGAAADAFPAPDAAAARVLADARDHASAFAWVAVLQVAAAAALGVFTAAITTVLEARGMRVAGVAIARLGGTAAAVLLAVSGLCTWCVAQVDDAATAKALSLLGSAAGGPGHVVMLGLLFAGVGLPILLGRLGQAWVGVAGLVLWAVAELAVLGLVTDAAGVLVPVARLGGLAWMLAVAMTLPESRRGVPRWDAVTAGA
jgi:hypothetical protein